MTGDWLGDDRLLLADRLHRYEAPVGWIFNALTNDSSRWLRLDPGEVSPRVLKSRQPDLVVWSSMWPVSPNDTVEVHLEAAERGARTSLRFRWYSDQPPRGTAFLAAWHAGPGALI